MHRGGGEELTIPESLFLSSFIYLFTNSFINSLILFSAEIGFFFFFCRVQYQAASDVM